MLMRTDPFRELDRFAQQVFRTAARPAVMPMDAWREGEEFVVEFDLPGIDADSLDIDMERNVVTVRAERSAATRIAKCWLRSGHAEYSAANWCSAKPSTPRESRPLITKASSACASRWQKRPSRAKSRWAAAPETGDR